MDFIKAVVIVLETRFSAKICGDSKRSHLSFELPEAFYFIPSNRKIVRVKLYPLIAVACTSNNIFILWLLYCNFQHTKPLKRRLSLYRVSTLKLPLEVTGKVDGIMNLPVH